MKHVCVLITTTNRRHNTYIKEEMERTIDEKLFPFLLDHCLGYRSFQDTKLNRIKTLLTTTHVYTTKHCIEEKESLPNKSIGKITSVSECPSR